MSFRLNIAVAAGFALAGLGFVGTASAAPVEGLQTALATSSDAVQVEDVRLVCPPFRPCFHAPGFYRPYGYGYQSYGYRPYGYGYGYGYRRHFY